MSETSQETYPILAEDQGTSKVQGKNRSSLSGKARSSRRVAVASGNSSFRSSRALLCDTWGMSPRQRLLCAFIGLAFVLPYVTLTLTHPDWTGHIGQRLSLGLFSLFGQGAVLVPITLGYVILSASGLRVLRHTRYHFALPLVLVSIMLIQRWSGQGGWLGKVLDGLLYTTLGPGGAWLLTSTLFLLACVAFIPRAWLGLSTELALSVERLRDWKLRLSQGSPKSIDERSSSDLSSSSISTPERPQTNRDTQLMDPKARFLFADSHPSVESSETEKLPTPLKHGESSHVQNLPWIGDDLLEQASIEPEAAETQTDFFELLDCPQVHCDPEEQTDSVLPDNPHARTLDTVSQAPEEDSIPEPIRKSLEKQAAVPTARAFELPPLALLDDVPLNARNRPTEDKSRALLDALDAFGVKANLLDIVRGPTVTRYELQPARGVKVSKFTSLTNDIALALASTAVRIEAPIPGKSAIGIEIPNEYTDLVVLKDILRSPSFTHSKGLTVALGLDLSGRPVVTDLQKMPHLLVAGTTGSGKSVCVNGLIISLLYRFTPDQLQLMMVDPKQVELSVYEDIPHLVGFSESEGGEIIVDPKKAAQALHQVVELMETRYTLFAETRVRNLAEYNAKAEQPLPWFVVIIDELADLMMVASKSVETSICRIAQKARAAGIHLVLATQRPSADVITGLIKVNIPSRAAFAVSSQVDSRVILDSGGAEHLLGKGDMLFLPVDASDPKRIQGSYVGNEEIARVVEFWKGQGLPDNRIEFELKEDPLALDDDEEDDSSGDDALLEEGLRAILHRDQASASMLQTELKVGYARARRLLQAMEKRGWVGPQEGSKPRKILYSGAPLGDKDDATSS